MTNAIPTWSDETPTALLPRPFRPTRPPSEPLYRCSRLGIPSFHVADDELEATVREAA